MNKKTEKTEKTKEQQIGRIAFRQEGTNWNAYYAKTDTMLGALFLGSVPMVAANKPYIKKRFMDLMRDVVGEVMKDVIGTTPVWKEPVPAPEHERTKE